MAFFALLWKARTIENYKIDYEKEKISSIISGETQVEQTLSQRWRHYRLDTKKRIARVCRKWFPDGSAASNFCLYLITDQTFPNFLLKSVMGFVGGIILTYLCFMFFVFQLAISLNHATIMSSIIGVLLTLGLAFSYRIRCLVFLLIPQFFSRVGRYTLTCYALVLILTGPATNTLKNSEVLSESMACSQEQIKTSLHQLNEIIKTPINAMKDSLKLMVDQLKIITAKVKETVIRIDRLVLSIANSIQSSFSWLQSVLDMCNAKLGTPYERCCNVIQDGVARCQKNMGPKLSIACNVASAAHIACYTMKPFKAFCYATDFMDEAILAGVKRKLRNFSEHLRAMFYVDIHIHHSYTYSSNTSRSASQVAAGIVTEIRNRADPLLTWLSWSSCVTSLFLLLIIFRAKYYQHMYETRSRFDNRYVTKELQELDLKRQQQGRETILPLNRRERAKYITTSSFRLVASEKVYLNRSAVFMAITTFKLLIHMVADYSLYWVLMTIRFHGRFQSDIMPGIPHSGAHVHGTGFVAKLFKSIIDVLDIPLSFPVPSSSSCLPDPYPPDFRRYTQIGVLIFLLWFFALFEPYGLRLRHLIMGHYRPERAKARAIWLFNHILRTRVSFMKFARRKLHREYKYTSESTLTFRQWITDLVPFQWLRLLIGLGPRQQHCLLCGTTSSGISGDPDFQLTKCHTPGCPGVFCTSCFTDIGELCTICLSPADYGDISDISLEKGSSDDSDSDVEFNEGRINENITSQSDVENNRIEKTINSHEERRWDFFSKTIGPSHSGPLNAIALLHVFKNERTFITTLFKTRLSTLKRNMENRCRVKNWITKLTPENKFRDFSTRENRNFYSNSTDMEKFGEFNKVVTRTKSIGINTDKNHGVLYKLVNSFTRRKSKQLRNIHRRHTPDLKHRNKISRFYAEVKSNKVKNMKAICQTNRLTIEKDNRRFLIKVFHLHNLTLRRRNLKNIVRSKKSSRTVNNKRYEELKGVMKTIRFFLNSKEVSVSNQNNGNAPTNSRIENRREINNAKIEGTQNKKKCSKVKPNSQRDSIMIKRKNSRHKVTKFHKFFSNHWNNFKCSIIPCSTKNRTDIPIPKVRKNHKRRKKRKLSVDLNKADSEERFARKEVKQSKNNRISAFLDELEWNKRDYRKNKKTIKETDSFVLTKIVRAPNITNKIVGMVQIKNMPFQWREAPKYDFCDCGDENCYCVKKQQSFGKPFSKPKIYAKEALQRFRNRVAAAVTPPSSLVNRMLSSMSITEADRPFKRESSTSLSKRASGYRSFTKEITHHLGSTKSQHCNNLKTDVLFKNSGYDVLWRNPSKSVEEISSEALPLTFPEKEIIVSCGSRDRNRRPRITKECKCDMLDDIQKKWDHVKEPKMMKMRNFCSTLFRPSCSKKICPYQGKQGEAEKLKRPGIYPRNEDPKNTYKADKKAACGCQTTIIKETHTQVQDSKGPKNDKILGPKLQEEVAQDQNFKIQIKPKIDQDQDLTDIVKIIEKYCSKQNTKLKRSYNKHAVVEPQNKVSSEYTTKDQIIEKHCSKEKDKLEKCYNKHMVPKIQNKGINTMKVTPPEQNIARTQTDNFNTVETQVPREIENEVDQDEDLDSMDKDKIIEKYCSNEKANLEKCYRKHAAILKDNKTKKSKKRDAQTRTASPQREKETIIACAATLEKNQNGGGSQRITPLTIRASLNKCSTPFSCCQTDNCGNHVHHSTQYEIQEGQRISTSTNTALENDRRLNGNGVTDKCVGCVRNNSKKDGKTCMSSMYDRPSGESDSDVFVALDYGVNVADGSREESDTITERSNSFESLSNGSKSDTTICSLATCNYNDAAQRRKFRMKVITKSNQATSTDKTRLCDTGTITDDWWSPIVERKGHETILLEKKKGLNALERQMKEWREIQKEVRQKRIVSFRSRAQIIPSGLLPNYRDVMSPSRYLLESQKYYNELFAGNFHPRSQAAYVTQMPKYYEKEKSRSPVGSRRNHLHRKTKRLDECYSPIKQPSPRRRKSDSTRTSDCPCRKLTHRYDRSLNNRHHTKISSPMKRVT